MTNLTKFFYHNVLGSRYPVNMLGKQIIRQHFMHAAFTNNSFALLACGDGDEIVDVTGRYCQADWPGQRAAARPALWRKMPESAEIDAVCIEGGKTAATKMYRVDGMFRVPAPAFQNYDGSTIKPDTSATPYIFASQLQVEATEKEPYVQYYVSGPILQYPLDHNDPMYRRADIQKAFTEQFFISKSRYIPDAEKSQPKFQDAKGLNYYSKDQSKILVSSDATDIVIRKKETVSSSADRAWLAKFNQLKQWTEKNKKLPELNPRDKQETMLAKWVRTQRRAKAGETTQTKMTEYRIQQLEDLPGWRWEENVEQDDEEGDPGQLAIQAIQQEVTRILNFNFGMLSIIG